MAMSKSQTLYVGGYFDTANGALMRSNVMKWDGTYWTSCMSHALSPTNPVVHFAVDDSLGYLYASMGTSYSNYGLTQLGIKGQITQKNLPIENCGMPYLDASGHLYITVTYSGGIRKLSDTGALIALEDTSASIDGRPFLSDSSGTVYFGSNKGIVKYNGVTSLPIDSSSLQSGIEDYFTMIFGPQGDLYVGGIFYKIGYRTVYNVANWRTNKWFDLDSGTSNNGSSGTVNALAADRAGNVYAGGVFAKAGGIDAPFIAKWNGSQWKPLLPQINGYVRALLCDSSGNMYVGGEFTAIAGDSASHIAKWNGTSWSTLGPGMNGPVYAFAFDNQGLLYAGGYFTKAGTVAAKNIAVWNGSQWNAIGPGIQYPVAAIAFSKLGNLYAGMNGPRGVVAWNGSAWIPLGTGIEGVQGTVDQSHHFYVSTLVFDNSNNLYVGGNFGVAGKKVSSRCAKWVGDNTILSVSSNAYKPLSRHPIHYKRNGSHLLFSNIGAKDRIMLYSPSGQYRGGCEGRSAISLNRFGSQILIVRVFREQAILQTGKVALP
jgi:hypothetical protein